MTVRGSALGIYTMRGAKKYRAILQECELQFAVSLQAEQQSSRLLDGNP